MSHEQVETPVIPASITFITGIFFVTVLILQTE
jgi:hypothetical protein